MGEMSQVVSALLEESWLSSDSFLHRLCKVMPSLVHFHQKNYIPRI